MASLFSSTKNTRSILPERYRFLRSDVPDKLTDKEIQWLLKEQVTTVVDLREESETIRRRCPLAEHPSFEYFNMPVTGGDLIPQCPQDVPLSYIRMADAQMERIIEKIWHSKNNALFYCNAGKDRTGVVAAILLSKLGLSRTEIIEDYMMSKENLQSILQDYANNNPHIDIHVITPQRQYMEEFLDWLDGSSFSK